MKRLREVLDACTREELLQLASLLHGEPEPRAEWAPRKDADLVKIVERELGFQGSSGIAFLWRKVVHGREKAGVPYEEVVDDLIGATHLNAGLVEKFGEEIGDPLYGKEMLFALLFALAHPANTGTASVEGKPIAELLTMGLKAVKAAGFLPHKQVLEVAQAVVKLSAGKGGGGGVNAPLMRTLALLLGPVGAALHQVEAGRPAVSLKGPSLGVCALAVAAVGALRMKYAPLALEKLAGLEKFVASLNEKCRECGRPLGGAQTACVVCWVALHEDCGTKMQRIDTGRAGRVCGGCRRKDLEGEGLLVPTVGTLLSPGEIVAAMGYRAQVLNNRLDRSAGHIERALVGVMENAQQLRKDVSGDLAKMLRKAFGYLYVMFFITVFLTLFGIAYFKTSAATPGSTFNPGVYFRLSLLVMMMIPMAVWFFGALWKATMNAKREDFESMPDGRRLGFKDYLFGFLYYEHPIENIWGPITLVGATLAILMWVFLFR